MSLLNSIQQTLKVPKSQYNAFGKYNYRNAEDILEAVKQLLGEGTLTLDDEVLNVGGYNYVRATAKLYEKGELVAWAAGWAREARERKGMDDSQITGAASSYARKYALNGLFCIDDTKDADNQSTGLNNSPAPAPVAAKTAPPVAAKLTNKEMAAKDRIRWALGQLGYKDLTVPQVSELVSSLTGTPLLPENFDEIAEALVAKIEANEAK